jgi:putative aldouronate transport system substrate-binding protein
MDAAPVEGPSGRRLPGEPGNAGLWAIPKATVKTEAEMKKVLAFIDKLMDPKMATLLVKGVEGTHWADKGEFTEVLNRDADAKEVKPYRDTFPNRNENYNIAKKAKQPDLFRKNSQIGAENEQYIVPNPAHNLLSSTYSERGKELEQMITDAETKFIMGKIDEAGWQAEVEKWKKAGGEKLMQEYKEAYEKSKKK